MGYHVNQLISLFWSDFCCCCCIHWGVSDSERTFGWMGQNTAHARKAHKINKMFNSHFCGPDLSFILTFWKHFLYHATLAHLAGPQITLINAQKIKLYYAVTRKRKKEEIPVWLPRKVQTDLCRSSWVSSFLLLSKLFHFHQLLTFTWFKHSFLISSNYYTSFLKDTSFFYIVFPVLTTD